MKTCTFYIVFVTVLVNGGTAAELLEKLKLRASDVPSLLVNAECDTGGFGGGGGGGEEAEGGDGQGYQGRYLPWELRPWELRATLGDDVKVAVLRTARACVWLMPSGADGDCRVRDGSHGYGFGMCYGGADVVYLTCSRQGQRGAAGRGAWAEGTPGA